MTVTITTVEVTGISPTAGLSVGTNDVVITGSGFTDADKVAFTPVGGGTPVNAPSFTVDSDSQITAVVPNVSSDFPPGQSILASDIQVSAGVSTSGTTGADVYTFDYLEVTSVSPANGPLAGGTPISVNGSGFTGLTDVVFELADGTSVDVPAAAGSDTNVSVTTPAIPASALVNGHAVVHVEVVVTNDGITAESGAGPANAFTYDGPVVTGVSPGSGPVAGGTPITVSGSGLTGAKNVTLRLTNGTVLSVPATPVDDGTVTAVTPALPTAALSANQAVADVGVVVQAGGGTTASSAAVPTDRFTYTGPTVTGVSPDTGPVAGGTSLTVSGSGFTGATDVVFHLADGTVLDVPVTPTSDSEVVVATPALPAASLASNEATADVEVKVAGAAGSSATSPATSADQFTYVGPAVSGLNPSSGPMQGGTNVTVHGTGFTGATDVLFHLADGTVLDVPASASSDSKIVVLTPAVSATHLSHDVATADVEVVVAAAAGSTATSPATSADHFSFEGPTVSGLSASKGPVYGGTTVRVSGTNLSGASEVVFRAADGTQFTALASAVSATSVTAVTPGVPDTVLHKNKAVTSVAVEVPTADGSIAVSPTTTAATFTFEGPTVTKVSPATGLEGTALTVTGQDLAQADRVTFTVAGVAYSATPTSVTATSLHVVAPAVAVGALAGGSAKASVQVSVALPGPSLATSPTGSAAQFTYLGPKVATVSPSQGGIAGGTVVALSGVNLAGTDAVILTIGTTVLQTAPRTVAPGKVTFTTPAISKTLLTKGRAVAQVQVRVPTPLGQDLLSAGSSFVYLGP